MEVGDRIISKGTAIAPFPLDRVYKFMDSLDGTYKMSEKLLEWKPLYENPQENIRITYTRYKGIWPASDRDFVRISAKE